MAKQLLGEGVAEVVIVTEDKVMSILILEDASVHKRCLGVPPRWSREALHNF